MELHILTLFPEFFASPLQVSLLGKAIQKGIIEVTLHQLRDYAKDKHKTVDDRPFGGGAGMILKPEPLFHALGQIKKKAPKNSPVIYFTPRGKQLTQKKIERFAQYQGLILLCGRYEGVDQRVIDTFVDYEITMGDFIMAGGEVCALAFLESVGRLVPGVLGNYDSTQEESFSERLEGKIEYPLYTQPRDFKNMRVPEVLLSGNHKEIEEWKKKHCK